MGTRDYRDVIGGLGLIGAGGFAAFHALTTLRTGTLEQMGPGMFPAALGIILVIFGIMLAVPAFFRQGAVPQFRVWTPLFVFAGIAAFALMVRPTGFIPAVFALTVISSLAELKIRPVSLTILTLSLCVVAWLVFHVGLNLSTPMFRWPF